MNSTEMNDYRNTPYCKTLDNIKDYKIKLKKKIKLEHPRATNLYAQISSNKDSSYKNKFMKIYNGKCSYCGCSIKIISKRNFEIDHFICKSNTEDKTNKNDLSNLVLACEYCNRKKSNLIIEGKYKEQLHPDKKDITKIFYRDNLYNIKIEDTYKNDAVIKTFYDKLDFSHISRKLDYLLLNLKYFKKDIEKKGNMENLELLISNSIETLLEARNTI